MKWEPGTFTTEALQARIEELLPILQERASADRAAGRNEMAEKFEELEAAVREWMRLAENGLECSRKTIRILENAISAVQVESVL